FNKGGMTELNDSGYEEEVVNFLRSNYAHYLVSGNTTNRAANLSVISGNNNEGLHTTSTVMNTIRASMRTYIVDSAIKNPKRVIDKMVLNYDDSTGEFSSELLVNTIYEDIENDPKYMERFKTTHDPTVYENNTGVMEGLGQYQEAPTSKFTKVGKYEM